MSGECAVKINEIISESWYDTLSKIGQVAKGASYNKSRQIPLNPTNGQQWTGPNNKNWSFNSAQNKWVPKDQAQTAPTQPPVSTAPTQPINDISKTLPNNETQYRFPYPEEPTIDVIIRQDGYYLTRLPKHLQGQVKKDSKTGLFPVKLSTSISKINKYYDQAAELGKVKEEPVHSL